MKRRGLGCLAQLCCRGQTHMFETGIISCPALLSSLSTYVCCQAQPLSLTDHLSRLRVGRQVFRCTASFRFQAAATTSESSPNPKAFMQTAELVMHTFLTQENAACGWQLVLLPRPLHPHHRKVPVPRLSYLSSNGT
jgi:hypothetical protein